MLSILQSFAIDLPHPGLALLSALAGIVAVAVAWAKRSRVGMAVVIWVGVAAVLFALAAGGLRASIATRQRVQVMVDLSPSTRGAAWRQPGYLQRRIRQLLGDTPYRIIAFAEHNQDGTAMAAEMPAQRTVFAPPEPWPVLLFSDGQFSWQPGFPPTYAVVDDGLDHPGDAQIREILHERGQAIALLSNRGAPRRLGDLVIPPGSFRVTLGADTQAYEAQLSPGDLWPENDRLSSLPGQPSELSQWALGVTANGYKAVTSEQLPASAEGYSFVSQLLLDAGSAAALDRERQRAIVAYVQELGGTVVIVGQDARWAELRGSELERVSPLSVDPPQASTQWVVLLDASGSMAQSDRGVNKWQQAQNAAMEVIRGLPANDGATVGTFAADLTWRDVGKPAQLVEDALKLPANFSPRGPTNLLPALRQVLALPPAARRELLLLSDAEVELSDASLAADLTQAHVRVSCLLLGPGRGTRAMEQLCRATGGVVLHQSDPAGWVQASRELSRSVAPVRWQTHPVMLGQQAISAWNLTWPKHDAAVVAQGNSGEPLAATWNVGTGKVGAIAFAGTPAILGKFASAPQGGEYEITWQTGRVRVHVQRAGPAKLTLRVTPGNPAEAIREVPLAQVAPGVDEAPLPQTSAGAVATLYRDSEVLARHAVAPRYEDEFAQIGNDRENLAKLCQQTGGRIVERADVAPLHIRIAREFTSLTALAGLLGLVAAGIATALLRRKI